MLTRENVHQRCRHDIMADILETCKKGEKITNILYEVKTSYENLRKYVDFLIRNNLLNEKDSIYTTTEFGSIFLENYRKQLATEETA